MPLIRLTTDAGDWSTVPWRLRLAFILTVIGAAAVGVAFTIGVLSLAASLILISAFAIALILVFDRRRTWWPDEQNVPDDPVGRGARRNILIATAVTMAVVILLLTGVLRL